MVISQGPILVTDTYNYKWLFNRDPVQTVGPRILHSLGLYYQFRMVVPPTRSNAQSKYETMGVLSPKHSNIIL